MRAHTHTHAHTQCSEGKLLREAQVACLCKNVSLLAQRLMHALVGGGWLDAQVVKGICGDANLHVAGI